jgi:hypothetical protein
MNLGSVKEKVTKGDVILQLFLKILTHTGMLLLPTSQSTQILEQSAAHSNLVTIFSGTI